VPKPLTLLSKGKLYTCAHARESLLSLGSNNRRGESHGPLSTGAVRIETLRCPDTRSTPSSTGMPRMAFGSAARSVIGDTRSGRTDGYTPVMRMFSLLFAAIAMVMLAMFLIYVIRGPVDPLIAGGLFVSFWPAWPPPSSCSNPSSPPRNSAAARGPQGARGASPVYRRSSERSRVMSSASSSP
jgi:hypothetical protein